jgi:hypothetical protein
MTSKANSATNTPAITPPPPPITQDDPTWQKCLSLLKAMKEVTDELREEAEPLPRSRSSQHVSQRLFRAGRVD